MNSSKYLLDSDMSLDSEEGIGTYKVQYVEDNNNINFFKVLVPDTIYGMETTIFITNLAALKVNEGNLCDKQEIKFFRCKLANPKTYG